MATAFDSIAKSQIRTQSTVYGGAFFAKIVNDFQLFCRKPHRKC